MVAALIKARRGSGFSRPSSNRIMKSTHALRAPAQALYDRCAFAWSQAVASEDLLNLARFDIWHRLDLGFLPAPLARVMLGLAPAGEVAAKAHGDRACGDLGQSRGYH